MAYQLRSQVGRNTVKMRGAGLRGMGDAYDDYYLWYSQQSANDPGSYPYGGAMDRFSFMTRYNAGQINAQGIPISPDLPAPDVPTGGRVPGGGGGGPAPGGGGGGGGVSVVDQIAASWRNVLNSLSQPPGQPPGMILGMPIPVVLVGGAIIGLALYKQSKKRR